MTKVIGIVLSLVLAACSSTPGQYKQTACSIEPGSFDCQLERWHNTDAGPIGGSTVS